MNVPDYLLFDRAKWRRLIASSAAPVLEDLLGNGGLEGDHIAGELGLEGAFSVANPEVQTWISGYTYKFADRIAETAAERMREIMGAGMEAGEGIGELARRIREDPVIGPQADAYRAEMIARTEANRASNAGAEEAWKQSNQRALVTGQNAPFVGEIWRASPDACEFCVAMEARESRIGEAYFRPGDSLEVEGAGAMAFTYEDVERPPLHPNCRCEIEPILAEEYR